jgi:hypothetical protein
MKARLAKPDKDIYVAFTARFDGPSVTVFAARFPSDFFENPPSEAVSQLYRSQTIDLRPQSGRKEAARALLGLIRYLKST